MRPAQDHGSVGRGEANKPPPLAEKLLLKTAGGERAGFPQNDSWHVNSSPVDGALECMSSTKCAVGKGT